jgi:hypothetical protein
MYVFQKALDVIFNKEDMLCFLEMNNNLCIMLSFHVSYYKVMHRYVFIIGTEFVQE